MIDDAEPLTLEKRIDELDERIIRIQELIITQQKRYIRWLEIELVFLVLLTLLYFLGFK